LLEWRYVLERMPHALLKLKRAHPVTGQNGSGQNGTKWYTD